MNRARTFNSLRAILFFVALVAVGVAHAAAPRVPENIRQLMQDRDFPAAVAAIDAIKPDAEGVSHDYLAYLKARALHLDKKYDEAIVAFDAMQKRFADSPWARRGRFAKGATLARKGDFRAAELVYRAEAEYLLSVDRKQEVADIYLEFADAYFDPPQEEKDPDFKKALEFYGKAAAVGPKLQERRRIELRIAQCHQELKQWDEAIRLFGQFVKDHADDASAVEARFLLGQSQLSKGDPAAARRSWQDLLSLHANSKSERLAEATLDVALTHGVPEPEGDEPLSLGVAALRRFLEKYPEHESAGKAHLWIAQSYRHRGRYEDAVATLLELIAEPRYADGEQLPTARFMLGQAYKLQEKFDDALATWTDYLSKHPSHHHWSEAQREIVNTEFLEAADALKRKNYGSARQLWTAFLAKYPLDGRNRGILLQLGQMNFTQEKWDEAIADWRRLVSKYPKTQESSAAQLNIGRTLETKLGKLEEALDEYKKLTWGAAAGPARQRIARLTAKSMSIATERVFRSGQTPTIKFTSRNIESVTVHVYSVDLETYFRKMHLAGGVERLDIALIDPDATFEFEVPDYKKHQESVHQVEVPLPAPEGVDAPGSGVMAVTIGSKTLEATTMVVQSDLDLIVKSSRDEAFVFAENMAGGKPWPGVKLLVSDGKQVFAEGVTGDDGVFHKPLEQLAEADGVRVFGIVDGHVASNVIGLSGIGKAKGLSPRAYVYTDRPAYRPGQMVHVRGVVRKVDGDTFTVEEGKKYTVEIFDNRSRNLLQEEVTLGTFGSFHAHFLLPAAATQGEYRILVRDDDEDENYQGTFTVHQYQIEPIQLEVKTDRTVYYRGEEITGKIVARYYYGAPLSGREIRYKLADGRTHTAKTDADGSVEFSLPTRDFRETQPLALMAALPERNITTGKTFILATQGFSIAATTVRPVFLAGETFELTLETVDAEGKPIAKPLKLSVLERTEVDGVMGEVLVEEHELETDAESGKVLKTLKLDAGGDYVLRAEGTDWFENPISGAAAVNVSDEDDVTRLRILADRHTLKVGDEAVVKVHWREEPALALVTFQGAKILDYRLVELNEGVNELPIAVDAKLAPNFDLAVAVMTDRAKPVGDTKIVGRFHAAASPFSVERDLRIQLEVRPADGDAESIEPGDAVEVVITATDPQGKPVEAELSLAMVEQSLLARFGSPLGNMGQFFFGARRQSAVRTTSSITFAYRPKTRAINARLLAEEDRLALIEEERESLERHAERARSEDDNPFAGEPALTYPDAEVWHELNNRRARYAGAESDPFGEGENVDDLFGEAPAGNTNALNRQQLAQQRGGQAAGQIQEEIELGALVRQSDNDFLSAVEQQRKLQEGIILGGQGIILGRRFGGTGYGDRASGRGPSAQSNSSFYLAGPANGGFYYAEEWGLFRGEDATVAQKRLPYVNRLFKDNRHEIQYFKHDGTWSNLNLKRELGTRWDVEKAAALVESLTEAGAVLLPQLSPHETGYWNPSIATDALGKATVTFTMPERSTAWQLLAKGVTVETLSGEALHELAVSKSLFGQLKLPAALTDGDKVKLGASVHNSLLEEGQIEVTLTTTIGEKSVTETKKIDVTKHGIVELEFDADVALPADAKPTAETAAGRPGAEATFELTVAAGEVADVVRRVVPIRPYGMPVFAIAGGSSRADTTAFVEPAEGMALQSPTLQVIVGPTVERSLLDVVLAPAPWCQIEAARISSSSDAAVSDLMAALALTHLMSETREADSPQIESLDAKIRSSVSLLVSTQSDDGGWSWTGRGGESHALSTARVVWALQLARRAGYRVPEDGLNKAVTFLQTALTKMAVTDYAAKAVLLHGLAVAGKGDFPLANQLHRNRNALSAAGLAHLALALSEMDRKQMAAELLATKGREVAGAMTWNGSPAELRALFAVALEAVSPDSPDLVKLIDWLLAHRTGHRWSPDKATGPAMLALCRHQARSQFASDRYELTVYANDLLVEKLEIDAASRTQTLAVPAEMLDPAGKQRVRFEITGRGQFTYQCVLGGFVPADKLAGSSKSWTVERHVQPAPLELDGKPIPRGFDVLEGSYSTFRNPLTQLPVGQRGQVELRIRRPGISSNTPREKLDYLIVTEPIPAGVTVIEKSIKGGFDRFEIAPGAITFYLGSRHASDIRFDVHGYLPGRYGKVPTLVRNAYRPDRMAVTKPQPLTVLPLGGKSADKYRLTPRELYEFGSRLFAKDDFQAAGPHLTELVDNWNLNLKTYREAARMLLDIHLAAETPKEVVRYFEIVIEKYPELEIPFAKLLKIGDAYHAIGEYERSYLVFRAAVEAGFLRESQVAGFLQSQGEFARSVDVMTALLREYPPESYVASATYALAQRVYAKAPEAADDARLREKKITRVDLMRQAIGMLDSFLTAHPEDPAADEASFSLASALLELDAFDEAVDACARYERRYPKSEYLDSYWYITGYCHYARGEHADALGLCRKVAESTRLDPATGRQVESGNKWRAIYISGQIHHSRDEAAEAIQEYDRVKDRFDDARQAIDYFARKSIELPEVSTFQPGKSTGVELKFRNVAACDAKVYRIDLLKFSLLRRNLGEITKINLAGIRPHHQATVELGDGKDYRDRTTTLEVPLAEEGAYLVVCRAENLHTSGLVLVSPLVLQVREDTTSGQVRATIRDTLKDAYVPDVHVKVIGSRNDDFTDGPTDLRGIFVADDIRGTSTVIARAEGGQYAFFRGKQELGPVAEAEPADEAAEPAEVQAKPSAKGQLLEGLREGNSKIQSEQMEQIDALFDNDVQEGVKDFKF